MGKREISIVGVVGEAAEKVSDVVFDAPKVAVLVGTDAGVQLPAVFQSLEPGLRSHVCACAATAETEMLASSTVARQ